MLILVSMNVVMEKSHKEDNQLGQCMCGTIRFEFKGEPKFISECVCHSCRKAHGATAVGWVGVDNENFEILHGVDQLKWYQSSEESERGFCMECGTRFLFRSRKWPGEMHMTRTSFPDDAGLESKVLVFADEFPEWSLLKRVRTTVK